MKQLLSLENIRFMIVDDVQFMRRIFIDLLRSLNARNVRASLEREEAFKAATMIGADAILMKPFDVETIFKAILTFIDE